MSDLQFHQLPIGSLGKSAIPSHGVDSIRVEDRCSCASASPQVIPRRGSQHIVHEKSIP